MKLTALQTYNIEKALTKGKTIEAIRIYREATGCSLVEAKTEIDRLKAVLKVQKPWYFKDENLDAKSVSEEHAPNKALRMSTVFFVFIVVDLIIFAGLMYFKVFDSDAALAPVARSSSAQALLPQAKSQGHATRIELPSVVDASSYSANLAPDENFKSLYKNKINSAVYIRRKSSSASSSYDDSLLERKIKSARSLLAAQRSAPAGQPINSIARSAKRPELDGVMSDGEWSEASQIVVDDALQSRLYLQSDGEWLFIACDVPEERSAKGYDQCRIYFHAGLLAKLVNERIHIGRSAGLTSIRQTQFKWQGEAPKTNDERWKKYSISDWGVYQYAYGSSSMVSGHRQYEAAIHLGEAGLHAGVPFTLYAEIETDPLKDEQGKFVERRYLGELGSRSSPVWMVF